jgi:hypothetical protein
VGILLALCGVPVVLSLPFDARSLAFILAGWLAWSARELYSLVRAYRQCGGYRLSADGELLILCGDATKPGRLLPGCLVLDEFAWLRVSDERGRSWGELIAGKHRESEDWRRFQVIFRHGKPC